MRVLVTGSAGFIGSWVAQDLASRGHNVLGIDNLSGGSNVVPGIQFAKLDLVTGDLEPIVKDFGPEVVFHAAANAREGASPYDPAKVAGINVYGTTRLMEAAIKAGCLKRACVMSSMARYGDAHGTPPPFDESMQPAPVDPYGATKVCKEQIVKMLGEVHKFAVAIAVPHNVIGRHQSMRDRFRNVAALCMNRILRDEPIIVFGDGRQKRAFSAIQDSLPCFVKLVEGAGDALTINIGGQFPITVNELVDAIRQDMGVPKHPIKYLPRRVLEVHHAFTTAKRSIEILGYSEHVGWRECIRDMTKWARETGPQDWYDEHVALPTDTLPVVWR